MAAPPVPTFLQSVLSVAPLEYDEESWAFVRFCEVLPPDAEADFNMVRAHEVSRGEITGPELSMRIAQALFDRCLPRGRKPDPNAARAKALWKAWEANSFTAPEFVARWTNHSGNPIEEADTFPPIPAEIGEVLSATTNVHRRRVERDYPGSIFFGIVIGGAPGALIGFVITQVVELPAVPFTTATTVVASLLACALHIARTGRHFATWVGAQGLATVTDGKVLVFRFDRAARLEGKETEQVSNGEVIGKRVEYAWLNAKNRVIHRAVAVVPHDLRSLPETAPAHFVLAAVEAWKAFERKKKPGAISTRGARE